MRHMNARDMAEERKKKKGGEKEFVILANNVSNNGRDINKQQFIKNVVLRFPFSFFLLLSNPIG